MADQEEKNEQEAAAEDAAAAEETTTAEEDAAPEEAAAEEAPAAEADAEAPATEADAEAPVEATEEQAEAAGDDGGDESADEPVAEAPEESAPAADEPSPEWTYELLQKKTVAELRDLAQTIEHDALGGYSTMHKEHLIPALCQALGIEAHVHHEVVGINKPRVKAKIRDLKLERQKALDAGDHAQLKLVRKRIKSLKRKIRRATV